MSLDFLDLLWCFFLFDGYREDPISACPYLLAMELKQGVLAISLYQNTYVIKIHEYINIQ